MLDLNLPKVDGFEVLAEIAVTDSLRKIPVVVFTSSAADVYKRRALALGAALYVTKPASLDLLFAEVKAIWTKFRPRDELVSGQTIDISTGSNLGR